MVPSLSFLTRKKLKDILDVTTNVVVVVFAVAAIGGASEELLRTGRKNWRRG